MSDICLTSILFGPAGKSTDFLVKPAYMVIKREITQAITGIAPADGFAAWLSISALNIDIFVNPSKLEVFTRNGNHVAFFIANSRDAYSSILSLSQARAEQLRVKAAERNQHHIGEVSTMLKLVLAAERPGEVDLLRGKEGCVLVVSNADFSDYIPIAAPAGGWTHEALEAAVCSAQVQRAIEGWGQADAYLIVEEGEGVERFWAGSTEI